jgi:molybdenum cofactor biosynthesis enzyme
MAGFSAKRNDIQNASASPQQSLARHVIELKPDTIRIFEQQQIVSGRPLILARRANDLHVERLQERVQFVDVSALAGTEAEMMQADALLFECSASMFRRRRRDGDRRTSADAVIGRVGVDDRLEA